MNAEDVRVFLVGSVGAIAPEIVRLYNLRLQPQFRWSWGYILFSLPFVLLGGFVAWILEPSNNYAAFYSGISTPVLITTIAKNTGQAPPTPDLGVEPSTPPPDARISKGGNTQLPRDRGRQRGGRSPRLSWRNFWNAL